MTSDRLLDRLIVHLRTHVAELRRLERQGAEPGVLDERRALIARLQDRLAYAVRDALGSGAAPA